MRDEEIGELLEKVVRVPHEVEPAVLERVVGAIELPLRPVHPLPPTWVLAGGLVLICAAVGLAGAARAGFYGIEKMYPFERVMVFATLGILAWVTAREFVSEMIPGSRHRVSPGLLLGITSVVLLGVFALLFRDYQTNHFVSAGIVCLVTGLLHATPAALASWFLLRRGFAVDSVAAGLVEARSPGWLA
jgi:hypothetical protein